MEIQLNTMNFTNRNFTWTTDFNFSLSRNKLLEIGGEREVITQGERNENYIARVGLSNTTDSGPPASGIPPMRYSPIRTSQPTCREASASWTPRPTEC